MIYLIRIAAYGLLCVLFNSVLNVTVLNLSFPCFVLPSNLETRREIDNASLCFNEWLVKLQGE